MEKLSQSLQDLENIAKKSDLFCAPSATLQEEVLAVLKNLYDSSTEISKTSKAFGPFSELIVDGMDEESIWEEIHSRNRPQTRFIQKKIEKLLSRIGEEGEKELIEDSGAENDIEVSGEELEEDDSYEEVGQDDDDNSGEFNQHEGSDDEIGSDNSEESGEDEREDGVLRTEPLEEDEQERMNMDSWLDEMEELDYKRVQKKESKLSKIRGHKGAIEADDDDEEEEDDAAFVEREMYKDEDSDEDSSNEEAQGVKRALNGRKIMFSDFFVDDRKVKKSSKLKTTKQKVDRAVSEEEEEEEDEEGDDDSGGEFEFDGMEEDEKDFDEEVDDYQDSGSEVEAENTSGTVSRPLTKFERKNERLRAEIAALEADLVEKKPWDQRGEVKALDRPENSLLEVSADIERASKPAPIVTQQYTDTLEEIIIKRIKDNKFDDVSPPAPKAPMAADPDADLSQEKNSTGLGELYANEFLAQSMQQGSSGAKNSADEALRVEVKTLFHKICRQLDGLSHFFFTPKPVAVEGSVSVHLASLAVEDIAPSSSHVHVVSQAAPEEIMDKPRTREELLPEAERSREDRAKIRRAKKQARRTKLHSSNLSDQAAFNAGVDSAGSRKHEARSLDEQLKNDRRVVQGQASKATSYTNSSEFFSRLQDEVRQNIDSGRQSKRRKDENSSAQSSAGRVKL